MTLNFNRPLLNIKGEDTKQCLSDLLADLLASEQEGNAVKLYGWALKLANGKELELDKADTKLLEETIEKSRRIMVIVRAQLLEVFESTEKAKE